MLKNIPSVLSPDLLKVLMEMGHGDELVIADGNFPSASLANRLIRLDGHGTELVLESILKLFPLDKLCEKPVGLMEVADGDDVIPTIWQEYEGILKSSGEEFGSFEMIERSKFYDRSKKAYAIVATGESALYANIILRKGVI